MIVPKFESRRSYNRVDSTIHTLVARSRRLDSVKGKVDDIPTIVSYDRAFLYTYACF